MDQEIEPELELLFDVADVDPKELTAPALALVTKLLGLRFLERVG